jgi:hypothetical protein
MQKPFGLSLLELTFPDVGKGHSFDRLGPTGLI